MKITVTETVFRDAFQKLRPDRFSYEGLSVLFHHLEELDRDLGEEMELDVIAICCEWNECTFEEFLKEYDLEDQDDDEYPEGRIRNYFSDISRVAVFTSNSVVFANF